MRKYGSKPSNHVMYVPRSLHGMRTKSSCCSVVKVTGLFIVLSNVKRLHMEMISEVVKNKELLTKIYGDLAQPGVQEVGKALKTILGLGNTILWPVALANEKAKFTLQQNLNKYREKIEDIPEDKVVEVTPEIGVPVLEKLTYVNNEELRELYLELLSKASNKDKVDAAHPSFVNIINNLSPDEALILQLLRDENTHPFIEVRLSQDSGGYSVIDPIFSVLKTPTPLTYKKNVGAYLSNLEGLGVIKLHPDNYFTNEKKYTEAEELAKKKYGTLASSSNRKLTLNRGHFNLTSFGSLFIKACIPERKVEEVRLTFSL